MYTQRIAKVKGKGKGKICKYGGVCKYVCTYERMYAPKHKPLLHTYIFFDNIYNANPGFINHSCQLGGYYPNSHNLK